MSFLGTGWQVSRRRCAGIGEPLSCSSAAQLALAKHETPRLPTRGARPPVLPAGKMDGQGTFIWSTGERYDGQWKVRAADGGGGSAPALPSLWAAGWLAPERLSGY
jgi:hypothetical protein